MESYHHQLAWYYAYHGVKVFPCREVPGVDKKGKPIKIKAPYTTNGFHDASTAKAVIDGWWTEHPDALVGVPCKANGFIVFDADRHGGPDGVAQMQKIFQEHNIDPAVLCCVDTDRKGEHYLFNDHALLRDKIKGKLASAIEAKYNGYIIAAGSIVPNGGKYAVRGSGIEQLIQAISTRNLPKLPEVFLPYLNGETGPLYIEDQAVNENTPAVELPAELMALLDTVPLPYVKRAIKNETSALAGTAQGNRDNQFNTSCFNLGTLFAAEKIPAHIAVPFMRFAAARNGLIGEPDFDFDAKFKHSFYDGASKPRMSLADSAQKMMESVTIIPHQEATSFQQPISSDRAIMRRVSDVACEPIEWFWQSRIARGKVTLIAGDPGLGKSQLAAFMAAKTTTGGAWPNDEGSAPQGSVILLSCEDEISDTIRPRLEAAGADVRQVLVLEAIGLSTGARRGFSLTEDVPKLEKALHEVGDAVLLVIDPITAYMGKTDSHKTGDVRATLAPLQELASRYNVAIVGISHPNKNSGNGKAVNAVTGSNAYVAAARAAFLVAADKDNPDQRLFVQIKNNLGNAPGLSFAIKEKAVESNINAPYVVFNEGTVSITANEALGVGNAESTGATAAQAAEEFLYEELKHGAVPADELLARAKSLSISPNTLRRAKKNLHIQATKKGFQGKWAWHFPFSLSDESLPENTPKITTNPIDAQSQSMSIFDPARSSLDADKEDVS